MDFISVYKYLKGGNEDEGARPLPVEPSDKGRDYGHKLKHGRFCLNVRRQFSCEGGQTMGYIAQRDCGVSVLGDSPNPSGHSPGNWV